MSPTRIVVASLAALLLSAGPGIAAEPLSVLEMFSDPGMDLIAEDLDAGRISEAEAAAQNFYRLLRPEDGDPRYKLGASTGEPICGTPYVAAVHAHWDDLTPTQRHHAAETTDPLYRRWLRDGGISWEEGDVNAARAAQRDTCFDPSDLREGFSDYQHETRSADGRFEIHWNEGGNINEQRIGWMSEWFETAFDVEVNQLGFFAPRNITSNQLLVIVEGLGNGVYGYTGLAACPFGGAMSYIVMNANYVDDQVSLRPTAAHELFHAIQQVYGFEEFWGNDGGNRWWLEASAVYAASVTNPFDANRHALHAVRWATEHYKSMTVYDQAGHQYGMVVWAFSLANTLGDPVWHRDFWEMLRDRSGYELRDEFDDFLQERGSSFDEEYRKFMRDAATGAQSEFAVGIQQAEEWIDGRLLAGDHDAGDYPVEERIDGDARVERPEYLGQNYVFFDSDDVDRDKAVILEFWGDGEKSDTAVEWFVEFVAIEDDEVVSTHSMELTGLDENSEGFPREWYGVIQLDEFRSATDGVLMGVSPVTDFGDGGATWSYAATLVDSDRDAGWSTPETDDGDGDGDGGTGCTDCTASAASSSGGPGALALLLVSALGGRRRRRSAI